MNLFFWRKNKKEDNKTYDDYNYTSNVSPIKDFDKWLDNILERDMPDDMVAIYFDIVEIYDRDKKTTNQWKFYLIGTPTFDKDDPDWACEFDFYNTYDSAFLLERETEVDFEEIVKYFFDRINNYLLNGKYADILKKYQAIAVGFSDGGLCYTYINLNMITKNDIASAICSYINQNKLRRTI